jgi:flagellar basal-body rod modification protein FlgD
MINAISTNNTTTAGAAALKQTTGLNSDDFLQLLVTQLKNQDPLNPQDSSAFVTQLAQITQVEQTYDINTNLQSLLSSQNNAGALSSVSFIGKQISALGSQVSLISGNPSTLGFTLPSNAAQVSVQISDASGNTVRTLTQGATAAGANSITWDGNDNNNNALSSGTYSFTVTAVNANGQKIAGTPMIQGKVTGVKLDGTTPVLSINGIDVPLTSVVQVQ